jgi:type VI protein secretion system component VasF
MKPWVMLVGLVVVLALAPLYAFAQMQSEEKMLVGQVQSVDDSRTELTLVDGTKLVTPPGAQFNPGALQEGMLVVAMYREQDDGRKVLTRLARGRSEPVPDTPKRPE